MSHIVRNQNLSNANLPQQIRDDERKIVMKVGLVSPSMCTAYLQFGKTRVKTTIQALEGDSYTKMALRLGRGFIIRDQEPLLVCSIIYSTFACIEVEDLPKKEEFLAKQLEQALTPAILRQTFDKLEIEVIVNVLEDDGCVLSTAINCASVALSVSGIPIYDSIISSTVAFYKDVYIINPSAKIEQMIDNDRNVENHAQSGYVIASNMAVADKITQQLAEGCLHADTFDKLTKIVVKNNKKLKIAVDADVREYIEYVEVNNRALRHNESLLQYLFYIFIYLIPLWHMFIVIYGREPH